MASREPRKSTGKVAANCTEVTTATADLIRQGSREISTMADFLIAGGFKDEAQMLLDAAATCAHAATNIERKIDRYRQAVQSFD